MPRRPRICMYQRYLPPDPSGAGKQAVCLSKALRKRGYEVLLVGDDLHGRGSIGEIDGVPTVRMAPPLSVPAGPASLLSYWLRLSSRLFSLKEQFDILHIHGVVFPNSFATWIARSLGKRVVMKASLEGEFAQLGSSTVETIHFAVLRAVDQFVLISRKLVEEYRASGLPEEKINCIPNGVDTSLYKPVSASEKVALKAKLSLPSSPILVYHGFLGMRKGILWLLDAIREDLESRRLTLLLIGSPPRNEQRSGYYKRIAERVRTSALAQSVLLLDHRQDIHEYLQAADAFILPSRREGLANALLEAMAVGLVPIVSRTSGSEEVVIHEKSGFLFEPTNVESLRSCLNRYLAIHRSEDQRPISRAAVCTIREGYSIDSVADRYEALYDKVSSSLHRIAPEPGL